MHGIGAGADSVMNRWLTQPWFRWDGTRGEVRAGLRRMTDDLGVDHFARVLLQGAGMPSPGAGRGGCRRRPWKCTASCMRRPPDLGVDLGQGEETPVAQGREDPPLRQEHTQFRRVSG